MKNELIVPVGNESVKCILMEGFSHKLSPTQNLHRHGYAELHVLSGGEVLLELEDRLLSLSGHVVFVIPAGLIHRFVKPAPELRHSAFLMAHPFREFSAVPLSRALAEEYLSETEVAEKSGNYASIRALIALFASRLLPDATLSATPVTDLNFLVNNFINLNYTKDVCLADLARELHFSEKQTARLVQKYTGRSFKQALVNYRLSMAKHWEETTNLSLSEIASRVGYRSYNGFWKAYKQYQEEA